MKGKSKQKEPKSAILLITLTFLLILSRILYIDIAKGDLVPDYRDPEIMTEFYRGTIYAEDGNILAIDVPTYSIHFSDKPVREPARIAAMVSPYTSIEPLVLERMLRNHRGTPFTIQSSIGTSNRDEFLHMIDESNLEGLISIEKTIERQYPFSNHGEFVIGRIHDGVGISGAELVENQKLSAPLDLGKTISKGEDITLAIDMELQYAAETVLLKLLPRNNIYSMLAILDRNTLEIMALDQTQIPLKHSYIEILGRIIGTEPTLLSSDEKRPFENLLPTFLGSAYIKHYLSDQYLILSISPDEKYANAGLGTLKALLEARDMI